MKRNRFNVWIIFLLSLSLLWGCTSSKTPAESPGSSANSQAQTPQTDAPVAMNVGIRAITSVADFTTNWFTNYLQETFNVEFTLDVADKEREQLVLNTGDYPHVYLSGRFDHNQLLEWGQRGVLIPLNDLIDQHAPNIKKVLEETPGFLEQITAPDGNIYGLPDYNECRHCRYPHKAWVNMEFLENLGLEMPTTTDEFRDMLIAFRDNDPNRNGVNDEIPFTGHASNPDQLLPWYLMNAFIYTDSKDKFIYKDGEIDVAYTQPEWREGLRYMRELYAENLIDPGAFTQSEDDLRQLMNRTPDIVGLASYPSYNGLLTADKPNRDTLLRAIPPLKGPKGVQWAGYSDIVDTFPFVITNKATEEEQFKAIQMADYFYTFDGTATMTFGEPGKYWEKDPPGELDFNGQPAKYKVDNMNFYSASSIQNSGWNSGPTFRTQVYRESEATPQEPPGTDQFILNEEAKKYTGLQPKERVRTNPFLDPDVVSEANELSSTIRDYVNTSATEFIIGRLDINNDNEWDNYLSHLKRLGLSRWIEIRSNAN